ncbi:MAG: preprotein translocase subunit SecG [Elusimicrobia bacterium]|nr:preprotein translocase subunit SecG [Candidatus Liberimonas magnetica]
MYVMVVVLHVIVCIGLVLIVLLQSGKGGGIAGLFGGGGSDQLFSAPSGMIFIKKVTVVMAIVFILTSLFLTISTSRREFSSVTSRIPIPVEAPQPPVPGQ